jgi:hypothetical protein
LSKEDFNKTTDFTFEVVDSAGAALSKGGLSYRTGDISFSARGTGKGSQYNLLLIPAFVNSSDSMTVTINEETQFENQKESGIKTAAGVFTLYPSIPTKIELFYTRPEIDIPENAVYSGKALFQSSNKTVYELPLLIDSKEK